VKKFTQVRPHQEGMHIHRGFVEAVEDHELLLVQQDGWFWEPAFIVGNSEL